MVIESWLQWFPPSSHFLSLSLPPILPLSLSLSFYSSTSLCLTLSHDPSLHFCSLLFLHLLSCPYLCHFLPLFVWYTERCTNEVMAVGINSVREILVRVPAILREPDMGDFIEGTHYKYTTHNKTLNHIIPLQTTLQSLFERSYVALYITILFIRYQHRR